MSSRVDAMHGQRTIALPESRAEVDLPCRDMGKIFREGLSCRTEEDAIADPFSFGFRAVKNGEKKVQVVVSDEEAGVGKDDIHTIDGMRPPRRRRCSRRGGGAARPSTRAERTRGRGTGAHGRRTVVSTSSTSTAARSQGDGDFSLLASTGSVGQGWPPRASAAAAAPRGDRRCASTGDGDEGRWAVGRCSPGDVWGEASRTERLHGFSEEEERREIWEGEFGFGRAIR